MSTAFDRVYAAEFIRAYAEARGLMLPAIEVAA